MQVLINGGTKESSYRCPQNWGACAALSKSPLGSYMSSHVFVSEQVAYLRKPCEKDLLGGNVDTSVVKGLLDVRPLDVVESRRQI